LAAVYPAWLQARLLTSGDGIAQRSYAGALRGGLVVLFVAFAVLLWLWHARAVSWGEGGGAPRGPRWQKPVGAALGVLGILVLTRALGVHLDYYAYFAVALVWPAWFSITTLVSSGLAALEQRGHHVAFACWLAPALVAASTLLAPSLGIVRSVPPRGHAARVAETLLVPAETQHRARISFADTARFDCTRHPPKRYPPLPLPREQRRNVIFVSVDTLRADMLGRAVQGRPLMPHLTRWAERTQHFRRAQTTYPATSLALGSVLTGLMPSQLLFSIRIPENIFSRTRASFDRQLVVLPDEEWFRLPLVENAYLQGVPTWRAPSDAEGTSRFVAGLKEARAAGQRTFAWLHYFGPHNPYEQQAGFYFGESEWDRYLSEVAAVDVELGKVFDALEADGWLEDSLVIFASDHGEAFGEHGFWTHSVFLNGWITAVPLLVHFPGHGAGKRDEAVSLADFAPTILHFLDGEVPGNWTGTSWLAARTGEEAFAISETFPISGRKLFGMADRPQSTFEDLLAELQRLQAGVQSFQPKVSLVAGNYRMIVDRQTGHPELFDFVADPGEATNLVSSDPERARRFEDILAQWHQRQSELIYCAAAEAPR
jgi:arylsulfatase A-like enzyme